MGLGGLTNADTLRGSTAHSLRLAAERGLKSIAFPAIGTGITRFPMQECAEIMLEEAMRHLEGDTSLQSVYFVLFDEAARDIFAATWKRMQSGAGKATST